MGHLLDVIYFLLSDSVLTLPKILQFPGFFLLYSTFFVNFRTFVLYFECPIFHPHTEHIFANLLVH